jgi:7,8-dihydroneopterin 2',3'-cyclic phosphate phosphodiesterase
MSEVENLIRSIKDKKLREKVEALFKNPTVKFESDRLPFQECPGGSYVHHAHQGGLLQHTIAMTRIALLLCDIVEEVYRGSVDRDIVIAGALLHDLMKCQVYTFDDGMFISTPLGERIDHLTLLVAEMYEKNFPLEVIHTVVAHHGDNSPLRPRTIEALIVYMADFTDAELSRRVLRAAEGLVRRSGTELKRRLTTEEALRIVKIKEKEGWEGTRKTLHKLKETI